MLLHSDVLKLDFARLSLEHNEKEGVIPYIAYGNTPNS